MNEIQVAPSVIEGGKCSFFTNSLVYEGTVVKRWQGFIVLKDYSIWNLRVPKDSHKSSDETYVYLREDHVESFIPEAPKETYS